MIQHISPTLQKNGAGHNPAATAPDIPTVPTATDPTTVDDTDVRPANAVADNNPTAAAGPFKYIRQLVSPGGKL